LVWKHFNDGGNVKLALLCLAEYADADGVCWPSMSTIALRLACSESHARTAVHRLLAIGVVEVIGNAFGGAPGSSRRYKILTDRLTGVSESTPTPSAEHTRTPIAGTTRCTKETGVPDKRDGCARAAETGSADYTLTVIEPPRTVKKRSRRKPTGEPTGFLNAWELYPKRAGGNPRDRALKAWNARIREGSTQDELLSGVHRYAAYVRATAKEGTEYVQQAATFFGPSKGFLEAWTAPAAHIAAAGNGGPVW
jgi:hypothetical protein